MNLIKSIIILAVFYNITQAQIDTNNVYPLQLGNYWEYRDMSVPYPFGKLYYDRVIKDTLMPNGKTYWQIGRRFLDEPDEYYRFERTEYNKVFFYTGVSSYCTVGEEIFFNFTLPDSTIWATCTDSMGNATFLKGLAGITYEYFYIFGDTLECKLFHSVKVENGDTIWDPLGTAWPQKMAKGVGKISELFEQIGFFVLQGAIIDGKRYGTIVGVEDEFRNPTPASLNIFPNPSNSASKILYSLSRHERVKLELHNILGESISLLVYEEKYPGEYSYHLNTNNLSSGIYIIMLSTEEEIQSKILTILK